MRTSLSFSLIISAALLAAAVFSSCAPPSDGAGSDTADISFSVSGISASMRGDDGSRAVNGEVKIFTVEPTFRFPPEPDFQPLETGVNTITAVKDSTLLIGLANIPAASGSLRSIGSAISTLGTVSVVSSGLDSLPLADDAQDEIDLGELALDETEQTAASGMDSADAADSLGHSEDTLTSFGRFDQAFSKYSNLDIDNNNGLDTEDGLRWNFITQTTFDMVSSIYNPETETFLTTPSGFRAEEFEYMFILVNYDNYTAMPAGANPQGASLIPPENSAGITSISSIGDYYASWNGDPSPDLPDGFAKYLRFREDGNADFVNQAPFDGNYQINVLSYDNDGNQSGGWTFYLNNMNFLKPADNYEGFIFPVVSFETDQNGLLQTVGWRWKKVQGGVFMDATSEEVRLQVMSFVLAFDSYPDNVLNTLTFMQREMDEENLWHVKTGESPWYGFKLGTGYWGSDNDTANEETALSISYSDSGTLNVSSYTYPYDHTADSLIMLIEDTAGNFYGFKYSDNALLQ